MLILLDIEKSNRENKKWKATFTNTNIDKFKTVHFGDSRYEDYTIHKNKTRMLKYKNRHNKDNLNNPLSPGSLSMYILWSDPSFTQGLVNYSNHYNIMLSPKLLKRYKIKENL